ncbi:MAG: GMC family oxidoreductase, partial [Pararhizobium sp.]
MEDCDYIIVGAGSAGCVLANRLTEDPHCRVLLIEAGGSERHPIIAMPAATDIYGLGNPRWDWNYETEPDPTRGGRKDIWPRGKGLGGSGLINGMVYMRGHPRDYDAWEAEGAAGWNFESLLPYFRRSEDNERGGDAFRGSGGPMMVSDLRDDHPLSALFIEAGVNAGLSYNGDIAGAHLDGIGPVQATQKRGRRWSAANAYLRPAMKRPNLRLLSHAHVTRLLIERRRVVGVEYRHKSGIATVRCRAEVILAAGAIASPQILLLSGIGPAADLRRLGIRVQKDVPGVGRNLRDHVGAYQTYEVDLPTYNAAQRWYRKLQYGLTWMFTGRGPASTPGAHCAAFVRTEFADDVPDVQILMSPVGYALHADGLLILKDQAITFVPNVNRPESRGRITLRTADPFAQPLIDCRLLDDPRDLWRLVAGCRMTRDICRCDPLAAHI